MHYLIYLLLSRSVWPVSIDSVANYKEFNGQTLNPAEPLIRSVVQSIGTENHFHSPANSISGMHAVGNAGKKASSLLDHLYSGLPLQHPNIHGTDARNVVKQVVVDDIMSDVAPSTSTGGAESVRSSPFIYPPSYSTTAASESTAQKVLSAALKFEKLFP